MNGYIVAAAVVAALLLAGCVHHKLMPPPAKPVPAPYLVKFEKGGLTAWGITAYNNEQLYLSDFAYANVSDTVGHYARTRAVMQIRNAPSNIVRYPEDGGKFRWILNDADGKLLERSDQAFASANAARDNFDDVRVSVLEYQPYSLKLSKFTL